MGDFLVLLKFTFGFSWDGIDRFCKGYLDVFFHKSTPNESHSHRQNAPKKTNANCGESCVLWGQSFLWMCACEFSVRNALLLSGNIHNSNQWVAQWRIINISCFRWFLRYLKSFEHGPKNLRICPKILLYYWLVMKPITFWARKTEGCRGYLDEMMHSQSNWTEWWVV